MDKLDTAYKTIGEVAKLLNLKSNEKGVLPTHIIRFWETQFKQIKPKIFNSNRRYYDEKTINLLKKIKFLLKDQGMTINGVKKILNSNRRYYDEKTINLLKKVKFLLKEQGMTINGVKKMLNSQVSLKLDEIADKSIKAENLKNKLVKISKIIKQLK